jgi:hypothetical protein
VIQRDVLQWREATKRPVRSKVLELSRCHRVVSANFKLYARSILTIASGGGSGSSVQHQVRMRKIPSWSYKKMLTEREHVQAHNVWSKLEFTCETLV